MSPATGDDGTFSPHVPADQSSTAPHSSASLPHGVSHLQAFLWIPLAVDNRAADFFTKLGEVDVAALRATSRFFRDNVPEHVSSLRAVHLPTSNESGPVSKAINHVRNMQTWIKMVRETTMNGGEFFIDLEPRKCRASIREYLRFVASRNKMAAAGSTAAAEATAKDASAFSNIHPTTLTIHIGLGTNYPNAQGKDEVETIQAVGICLEGTDVVFDVTKPSDSDDHCVLMQYANDLWQTDGPDGPHKAQGPDSITIRQTQEQEMLPVEDWLTLSEELPPDWQPPSCAHSDQPFILDCRSSQADKVNPYVLAREITLTSRNQANPARSCLGAHPLVVRLPSDWKTDESGTELSEKVYCSVAKWQQEYRDRVGSTAENDSQMRVFLTSLEDLPKDWASRAWDGSESGAGPVGTTEQGGVGSPATSHKPKPFARDVPLGQLAQVALAKR